jgi:glycosyltransferase involved in cell wall biosynthesis
MNILHLTPDFNFGDGRSYYVYLLLKYLKRSGHNVILFTNGGDSFERLEESGVKIFQNKSYSQKTSFLKSVKELSEIIDTNKIEIIHSHHRYFELMANSAAKICGQKVETVFTALSIVNKRYGVEYKSDKIIAVSNCVKEMLINKFKINSERVTLIPNFVDSEEIDKNHLVKIDKKEKISGCINILSIGRFHKDKDQLTLLESVKKISENTEVSLTLIGEGEEKEKYVDYIFKNSLNVKLIPPQKDLKEYFEQADICVLASVRDPFPGFMLQSGMYKKPFIGADTDGISELIIDNENGLLFQKKNSDELAAKIEFLIKNKTEADKFAENLHWYVMDKFTEKQVMPEIEKLYGQLGS